MARIFFDGILSSWQKMSYMPFAKREANDTKVYTNSNNAFPIKENSFHTSTFMRMFYNLRSVSCEM
jgi:hypothetical protein